MFELSSKLHLDFDFFALKSNSFFLHQYEFVTRSPKTTFVGCLGAPSQTFLGNQDTENFDVLRPPSSE